jgi:zinc D-Ala-D-Ala carboxypeptidase
MINRKNPQITQITQIKIHKSAKSVKSVDHALLTRIYLLLCMLAFAACGPVGVAPDAGAPDVAAPVAESTAVSPTRAAVNQPTHAPAAAPLVAAVIAPATPTAVATVTASPTPTATATPTFTPTPTPIGPCAQRRPADDLLILITRQYGLSREYEPADLAPLSDYLPSEVTLGYPTLIREVIALPLQEMVTDMWASGLRPFIISGYRSYAAQSIAWTKWINIEGEERAGILSAPPGHSEHQLGTTVDFGSPELADIIGEEMEFHTYFYRTSEGLWLAENAHKYGFTLSYPRQAFDLTGFYYEPWHFRYVGVDIATHLYQTGSFLTEYQLLTQEPPCIP